MAKRMPALTGKVRVIKYTCESGTCKVRPRSFHMQRGDVVVMLALGTDVTIDFVRSSPFVSGTDPIAIPKDSGRLEIVAGSPGTFTYDLDCGECGGGVVTQPEMIVP